MKQILGSILIAVFCESFVFSQNDCIITTDEFPCASCTKNYSLADSTLSFQSYLSFLVKLSDTTKYLLVPMSDFATVFRPDKVVIGLRHDVDISLVWAQYFASREHLTAARSTFYILHTAQYYSPSNIDITIHDPSIFPMLHYIQDSLGDEIGWHNDLLTLQAIYQKDPQYYFYNELKWLRNNGIHIRTSSAHGSSFCSSYHYLNWYFFREYDQDTVAGYPNNITANIEGTLVHFRKGTNPAFELDNEAYHTVYNKYFSDVMHPDHSRWNVDNFNYDTLVPGDRVQILIHPYWWHNSYRYADFYQYRINGQFVNSWIDPFLHTVVVAMPDNVTSGFVPEFVVSAEVLVYRDSILQLSGVTPVDFSSPVTYSLVNTITNTRQTWTVTLTHTPDSPVNMEKSGRSIASSSSIRLYPVPVSETLHLAGLQPGQDTKLEITDITGKTLMSEIAHPGNSEYHLNTSALASGFYILNLKSGQGSQRFTFIRSQ